MKARKMSRVRSGVVIGLCGVLVELIQASVSAAPSVTRLSLSSDSVGRYEIIELRADVTTEATNPFWPYDPEPPPSIPPGVGVTVDGLFSDDNWNTTITVPGFLYLDYERYGEGFVPVGRPEWRVRFAPPRTGTWRAKLRVTDASGTTTHPEGSGLTFECTASQNHGFVRVSERDPRYFELSDGTPLLSPGVNVASPRSIEDMESKLSLFGANGVRLVRWWMTYRGLPNPFGGGDVATAGGPQWTFSLSMDTGGGCKPGDRYSAKLTPGKSTYQGVYLLGGRSYRFAGYIKSISVAAPAGQGIVPYIGNQNGTPIVGSTDWTRFEMYYTPSSDGFVRLGVKHTGTEGTGYFDDVELRYTTDGGASWSENCLVKGDFDFQNYIDLQEAYKADLIFQAAKQHGVYLKVVITEKQDKSLGCIAVDGSTVERSDNNFYASQNHPSRWLQQAWWRYLTARWGAFTSVHSWELCNEGDPFNGNHWNAASALADYVHSIDPNRHLVSTSNWHSFPPVLWERSEIDYADLHMGLGWMGTSSGNRLWPGWDGIWCMANLADYTNLGSRFSWDTAVAHTGRRSLKVLISGTNECSRALSTLAFQCGAPYGHTIRISFYARGENIALPPSPLHSHSFYAWLDSGGCGFVRFVPGSASGQIAVPAGTYDWTRVELTFTNNGTPKATILGLQPRCDDHNTSPGFLWIDDLVVEDLTTGLILNYNGGFEEIEPESYDVVAGHCAYSRLTRSYQFGKPTIRGEVDLWHPQRFSNPYKGFEYTGEDQLLILDEAGVWWRKLVWAHLDPGALYDMFWSSELLLSRGHQYAKAFQHFISGIPLSNGHYQDVQAETTNPNMRVLGQRDLVNNRAHIWIDNAPYTWKAVVDHNNRPEPWSSSVTYAKGSTCGAGNPIRIYKSLQDNNRNHPVTDTEWWQDMGEFNPANNPPLPPPVSGDVIISGLADGLYQVEWWDTSTGAVMRKEDVQCAQGKITLTVTNLVSDVACKIAPAPPALSLRLTVIEGSITPGSEVTIAVDYTNTGATEALNAAVTARVPAEMDYIEGSAEATGGSYDPVEKSVTWIVERIAAGETGRRIFKARVR